MTKHPIAHALAVALSTLGVAGCGGAVERQTWENTFTGSGDDAFLVDDDFVCLDDARWDVRQTHR